MKGKTEAEIIKAVGLPNSRSLMADGGYLLQWQDTGYHIAILFNASGVLEMITHEYVARGY